MEGKYYMKKMFSEKIDKYELRRTTVFGFIIFWVGSFITWGYLVSIPLLWILIHYHISLKNGVEPRKIFHIDECI